MKKYITPVFFALIGFVFWIELGDFFNTKYIYRFNNQETYKPNKNKAKKGNKGNVYFLGDSYASTEYVAEPFPNLFKNHFERKGFCFHDFSKAGSNMAYHKMILDSIGKDTPELIIYFYNISDIVDIDIIKPSILNRAGSINLNIINLLEKSKSILFFKKSIQFVSLKATNEFLPGTSAYSFPYLNKEHQHLLHSYFQSIKAKNVVILINTPFNAADKVKNWDHYTVFKKMDFESNYQLIQASDIISNPDYSVSWRNEHPNQEAIKKITNYILEKLNTSASF